jgi:hypothetical protein
MGSSDTKIMACYSGGVSPNIDRNRIHSTLWIVKAVRNNRQYVRQAVRTAALTQAVLTHVSASVIGGLPQNVAAEEISALLDQRIGALRDFR